MQADPKAPRGLPVPDDDSLAHCRHVTEFIRARIEAAGGSIGFAEYMQHALYAPGLGYYAAGATKFGAEGDFVTAPEVSPLFGRVLARQCADVLDALGGGSVLELGAGSGALALSMLEKFDALGAVPASYDILEVSPELTARQQTRLAALAPAISERVRWLDRLPESFDGVVVANEVADALPVERFVRTVDGVRRLGVTWGDGGFEYVTTPPGAALENAVREIERELGAGLPVGYVSEVCLALGPWLGDVLGCLRRGIVFLFDYGVSRREYYAPDRDRGWLRCHFRHHAHDEPLVYPGIQDITAWVDFTAAADAATRHGADVAGFVTQALFLLHGGLENEFRIAAGPGPARGLALAGQVKRLTLPGEMGENFKCLGLRKGEAPVPGALSAGDRAHAL